jgi:peptidoglycan/LPS O-acetylase OafA/YrhL
MLHVYSSWFDKGVTASTFKKFTIARFARVYPLHILTLLFVVMMYWISHTVGISPTPVLEIRNGICTFFTHLFLLQSMNFHDWFAWVHASWSISTEWWAYMVFPFLVAPIIKTNMLKKILIIIACIIGYWCITFLLIPLVTFPAEIPFVRPKVEAMTINVSYQYGIVRCLCGFIIGMVIQQLYANNWMKSLFANGYAMVIATIVLFALMSFGVRDMITVLCFPIIILSGAHGSNNINKLFSLKPLQKIGDWSFAIYLTHQPLIYTINNIYNYVHPPMPGPPPAFPIITAILVTLVILLIVTLISALVYKYYEVPSRKRINSLA